MRKLVFIFGLVIGLVSAAASAGFTAETPSPEVINSIRDRVENAGSCPVLKIRDQLCHASLVLPQFYRKSEFCPVWGNDKGISTATSELLETLGDAELEGLRSSDYHLYRIEALVKEIRTASAEGKAVDTETLADLDFLLTDAFLVYAYHLLNGRVDPQTVSPNWHIVQPVGDLTEMLRLALKYCDVRKTLKGLAPTEPGYVNLRNGLKRYREIRSCGGWMPIPSGPKLENGVTDPRVPALCFRLALAGDLKDDDIYRGDRFDDTLEAAVRSFQGRHGLDQDGVVGPQTLSVLNVPVEDRIRAILVNMERWRWLPIDLEDEYLMVDIANYHLYIVEHNQPALDMRVVVGKPFWSTPVFNGMMTYLVMNPFWNVPLSIALKETLPAALKDPAYLDENRIRMVKGWGAKARILDPSSTELSREALLRADYRFRQDSGPGNALGQIKFMFPNRFNVYLHDTPAKSLFQRPNRSFSHGCIRVEEPVRLAIYLLRNDPAWPPEVIHRQLDSLESKTVRLPKPLPVHILYWTAWADENGQMRFRDDVYNRDEAVLNALLQKPLNP